MNHHEGGNLVGFDGGYSDTLSSSIRGGSGSDGGGSSRHLLEFLDSNGISSDSTIIGKFIAFILIWVIGLLLLCVLLHLGCSSKGGGTTSSSYPYIKPQQATNRPLITAITLCCGLIGLVCSFITIVNCEFLVVNYENAPNPNTDYPTSIGVWSIGYPKTYTENGANGDSKTLTAQDSEYFSLSINGKDKDSGRVCYYAILEDDLIQTKSNDNSNYEIDLSINEWYVELARTSSIVALGLGFISIFVVGCLAMCKVESKCMWIIASMLFLLTTIGQGLTLFLLEWELCTTEYECTLEFGAITSITATLFWLVSVIGTCLSSRQE